MLGGKTDEEVKKLYNIYMQQQTEVKGEMTGKSNGKTPSQAVLKWGKKVPDN